MKRMKKLTLAGISFLSIAVFAACQSKEKKMKWLWLLIQIVFHWYEVFHRIKRIKSISFTRVLILCVFLFFILIVLLKYYF